MLLVRQRPLKEASQIQHFPHYPPCVESVTQSQVSEASALLIHHKRAPRVRLIFLGPQEHREVNHEASCVPKS